MNAEVEMHANALHSDDPEVATRAAMELALIRWFDPDLGAEAIEVVRNEKLTGGRRVEDALRAGLARAADVVGDALHDRLARLGD